MFLDRNVVPGSTKKFRSMYYLAKSLAKSFIHGGHYSGQLIKKHFLAYGF